MKCKDCPVWVYTEICGSSFFGKCLYDYVEGKRYYQTVGADDNPCERGIELYKKVHGRHPEAAPDKLS